MEDHPILEFIQLIPFFKDKKDVSLLCLQKLTEAGFETVEDLVGSSEEDFQEYGLGKLHCKKLWQHLNPEVKDIPLRIGQVLDGAELMETDSKGLKTYLYPCWIPRN